MHQGIPDELPYTVAAEEFRTDPWLGSTADVLVSEEQVIKMTGETPEVRSDKRKQ